MINKITKKVIVSLTSYPARIDTVNQTIETLLNQTYKADNVVLWLGIEQFPNRENDLPKHLLCLTDKGLTIKYSNNLKAYTKLIPSLKEFPDDIIVTADDDILYPKNWLEILVKGYLNHPECIICHRATIACSDENGLIPVLKWPFAKINTASFNYHFTGVGGVLYPPRIFDNEIFNEKAFLQLSPLNDDLWFWAMAIKNNKKAFVVKNNITNLKYVYGTQGENSLFMQNDLQNQNDIQLKNILNAYPEVKNKIEYIPYKECKNKMDFLKNIFSIKDVYTNISRHKIITILGIKIKIKIN